jgi:hypothetical protein
MAGHFFFARSTRTSRNSSGRDYRTFECAKCDHTETVIAEDPLKSVKADWLDSGRGANKNGPGTNVPKGRPSGFT